MEKEHVSAVLIAVLAGIRLLYVLLYVILRMLLYSLLIFALLAALHNIGVYETPYIGIYLARVPIEASLVAVGVVLASLGAIGAWRRQKRDELLLVAVEDVWKFFDRASSLLTPVYGHVHFSGNCREIFARTRFPQMSSSGVRLRWPSARLRCSES